MKLVLVAVATVLLATACNASKDRYLPQYAAARTIARPEGPVVFTVGPHDDVVYVELRTLQLYKLRVGSTPVLLNHLTTKPDSLAVTPSGAIWAAGRDRGHHLQIWWAGMLDPLDRIVQDKIHPGVTGPASRFPVHLRMANDTTFTVGWSHNLFTIKPGQPYAKRALISDAWTDPVFTFGRGDRIWVADNALPGSKERLVRGRDRSVSHRNRFASTLPPYTNPSDMVLIDDELLLCSKTHEKVYRLHIGIEDVARRRDWMAGLRCDRNIGLLQNGSLVTATTDAIYNYPAR